MEKPKRVGVKWSIDEDKKLLQLINEKKTYEEIALEHNRNIGGIKIRVFNNIIYPIYKDQLNDNNIIEKISNDYNIDIDTINKYIVNIKNNDNKKTDKTDLILNYLITINDKLDKLLLK